MKQSKLEKIIEQARCNRSTNLDLSYENIKILPESIGNLESLTYLDLNGNQLNSLPESIGNLANLRSFNLSGNQLSSLPESIGNLASLIYLNLGFNQLVYFPNSIVNIVSLKVLDLNENELAVLPETIGNFTDLESLNLNGNRIKTLPESIIHLTTLHELNLNHNPLTDLSILNKVNILDYVWFLNVELPRRYWTKFSDWKSEWLLDEDNAEIRRVLIEQVGYEKICEELNAIDVDIVENQSLSFNHSNHSSDIIHLAI